MSLETMRFFGGVFLDERPEEREREYYEKHIKPAAVDWQWGAKFPPRSDATGSRTLVLRAKSYERDVVRPYRVFDVKPWDRQGGEPRTEEHLRTWGSLVLGGEETGKPLYGYQHMILPEGGSLIIAMGNLRGRVYFDAPIAIPVLWQNTCWKQESPWMSLTPFELFTQRSGVRFASGTVVVGGLGLGYFVRRIAEKQSVKRIVVIEKSRMLLDWYGLDLCGQIPKVTDVICGDVFDFIGGWTGAKYALDIWTFYQSAGMSGRLRDARIAGHKVWAWGSAKGPPIRQ